MALSAKFKKYPSLVLLGQYTELKFILYQMPVDVKHGKVI